MATCAICQSVLDGSPDGCRQHELLAGLTATLVAQVQSEHQRLARVRHPHLVPVLECGRAPDGALYVKSEPRDGEPLSRRIERGPVPWADAKRLIGQVGQALLEVHKAGLIHRDLAPENVLITPDGEARLFHVAVPRRTSAVGDPYTPPEQREGRPLDRRANTFSLGALLYHTATGSAPPPAGAGPLRPPSACRPGLPFELDRLVVKALEGNPMARQPLLRGLLSELEALPVSVAPAPRPAAAAATGPIAPPLPSVAVPAGRPAGVPAVPADRAEPARVNRSLTVAGFAPLAKLGSALPGAQEPKGTKSDEPAIDKDEIARLVSAMSRPTAPAAREAELTADEVLQAKKRMIEQMVRQAKTLAPEKLAAPTPAPSAPAPTPAPAPPLASAPTAAPARKPAVDPDPLPALARSRRRGTVAGLVVLLAAVGMLTHVAITAAHSAHRDRAVRPIDGPRGLTSTDLPASLSNQEKQR